MKLWFKRCDPPGLTHTNSHWNTSFSFCFRPLCFLQNVLHQSCFCTDKVGSCVEVKSNGQLSITFFFWNMSSRTVKLLKTRVISNHHRSMSLYVCLPVGDWRDEKCCLPPRSLGLTVRSFPHIHKRQVACTWLAYTALTRQLFYTCSWPISSFSDVFNMLCSLHSSLGYSLKWYWRELGSCRPWQSASPLLSSKYVVKWGRKKFSLRKEITTNAWLGVARLSLACISGYSYRVEPF